MAVRTYGTMAVDWEQRVDMDRLRTERLARAKQFLKESDLGALLCFDMNNIRYITATHMGTWAYDKLIRFCLLPQQQHPLHHAHPHRHVAFRQADPLLPPAPGRRADPLGLRQRCAPPRDL